jgi:hypothetical protein
MRSLSVVLAIAAAFPAPALACRDEPELQLSHLKSADLVVVAQVSNYRIVPDFNDPIAAAHRYELLQLALAAAPEERETIRRQIGRASDFARIDVAIEEVLSGTAPESLVVTWDTSWFKLPEQFEPGSYLIALQAPGKYVRTRARATSWTVLSPVCERSFLVPSSSKEAEAIRQQLRSGSVQPH